jgi:hypothetical protein
VTTAGQSGGFWQVQCIEEIKLLGSSFAEAVEAARAGVGGVFLDARQQRQRAARAGTVPLGLQPHAHDAEEDEGQEAYQGVGADALGYLPFEPDAAHLFFQLVSRRYERKRPPSALVA